MGLIVGLSALSFITARIVRARPVLVANARQIKMMHRSTVYFGVVFASHQPRLMKVYRGAPRPSDRVPCALTVGNFDGVHRGHQALLTRVAALRARAI